ncbi:hypothetical protein ACFY5D_18135 [Paeniglutamicibacter sp. NPDC012692]|uniref:hypothetical protein n=1 Tax=Paeniglutamicibacter sp. NPDC012692 TaxID=3364388 RepID=UPI0036C013D4
MATYKPGRLWRTFKKLGMPSSAFALYSEPLGTLYDSDITGVSIRRGKSERGGGSHPSTMEIGVKGQYSSAVSGREARFFMRPAPAATLAAHLGTTASVIERRFTGRLGATSVEDTGKRFITTYTAASWIAQMNYSPKHYTPLTGEPVLSVIAGLLDAANAARGINVNLFGSSDIIATDQEKTLCRDGLGKYATDLGILLQETRDGRTNVFGHLWRISNAAAKLATQMPLTRSQAISPAAWEQPNERPAVKVDYKITNNTGGIATRSASTSNPTGELRETVEKDWSYVQVAGVDNQLYREAYGVVHSSSTRVFSVPSITIDLLYLIGSDREYHRRQAAQLLELEAGDPVFFSGDWPEALRGAHFAEGITETITHNEWRLELSLVPYAHAVGDTPTPVVPARVWESATYPWESESRTWNQI